MRTSSQSQTSQSKLQRDEFWNDFEVCELGCKVKSTEQEKKLKIKPQHQKSRFSRWRKEKRTMTTSPWLRLLSAHKAEKQETKEEPEKKLHVWCNTSFKRSNIKSHQLQENMNSSKAKVPTSRTNDQPILYKKPKKKKESNNKGLDLQVTFKLYCYLAPACGLLQKRVQ